VHTEEWKTVWHYKCGHMGMWDSPLDWYVSVWLTETPAPSDFLFVVCYTNVLTYLRVCL